MLFCELDLVLNTTLKAYILSTFIDSKSIQMSLSFILFFNTSLRL